MDEAIAGVNTKPNGAKADASSSSTSSNEDEQEETEDEPEETEDEEQEQDMPQDEQQEHVMPQDEQQEQVMPEYSQWTYNWHDADAQLLQIYDSSELNAKRHRIMDTLLADLRKANGHFDAAV